MNELLETIETAWAVRRFNDEPVTEEEIRRCLGAAIQAPSGGNIQPWQFLVVTDEAVKTRIADIYRRAYDRYEATLLRVREPLRREEDEAAFLKIAGSSRHLAEHMADVSALVMFLMPSISMTLEDEDGPLDVGTAYASVYPAVQNFVLAARALGIGTTLTTVYRIYQDEVRAVCSIPERYEIVALLPLGRPRWGFGRGRRRPLGSVTHWNQYGARGEEPPKGD